MVHRGGLESNTEKNKKEDFNSCIAENAKTADDDISNNKIEESAPKAKQIKKATKKASPKSTTLPLSDHSISQTVVRLERSRLIKTKNNPSSKGAETSSSGSKSKRLSPVRAGLRSSSLESHTSTTSNNNNAKAKKKKVNTKKAKATDPIECPSKQTIDEDSKNAPQPKLSKQLPLSFICRLPLNRLSGILEKLKTDKTKCVAGADEDTSSEDKSNIDKNSSQCKTLCLYCDKRMSTVKVRARHIERFHTISKERRSSSRNPITPSSQDSKDLIGTSPTCSSSSAPSTPMSSTTNLYFSGCSYCSKSPKLQAVALENDLSALFFHLVDFHSDKYFGCKACAIRFQTAAKLSDHVQRIHSSANKISNPVTEDVKPLLSSTEEERAANDIGKSTPTKTRRQIKQGATEVPLPTSTISTTTQVATSSSSSSTINRNGSMFSNDEPILSRLGLTQNRLPRGRKGIRSRRQTNVDSVKPDTSLTTVKTRNKLGRFSTSNEPIETVFRTPTNTRIEPLSCTFDEDFYEKVFNNVRTNLSCHLDGKIGSDTDSNRPQSPPPLMPAIRSTVVKSQQVLESEVHTATSLAALTAFPTLLTAEQYGCDFGTAKIKRPITRHSWKWKWDSVKKYKYVNEGGKIVKKIKQPMLGLRDLSKLDMWTQLTMRQKHEVVRKQFETTSSQCLVEYTDNSREEKQRQVDQLNTILDSRRLPQIIMEQNEQTIIKIEITDEGFRYLASEVSSSLSPTLANDGPSTSQAINRIIPANLNLIPSRSLGESLRQSVVLSGEWARPRCYVCFGCGARFDKRKALEEHKMFRHPHVYSTHYEIVGRELIEGNLYKHFFIPLRALSRHKEYAQRILVNKKTDYSVSKSSSNSGNEEESLDSLHSVTASFTTLSSSKLSDDCDTDTKTAIENVSSFAEPLSPILTAKNDVNNSLATGSSSSMDCTKCNRNCHGMLELYRHMLDCSGDYAWSLAKKKKYRYYGSRKRRQFNRQNISALHLHRRKVKVSKDENESDETPKKKYMSPSTPRPRASDADSIRKMLENLPPKRVCREIIPNATKPRSRKFKTTASGRKIQQNSTNKCMTSNTTLTAISKKILRNHKLRAISEKDKITRNKKILNTKRKSARVKNRVIASKNVHSQNNKANTKTETRRGGIVRKIGATTKRFVKKIKKRLLGDKSDDKTANKNEKANKPTTEEDKKSSKTSAVRKLTFDKDHEVGITQDNSSQDKTPVNISLAAEGRDAPDSKIKEPEPSSSIVNKNELPTITIETNFEIKKLQDTSVNEDLSLSLRSEGSTENLHEQQSDLSASTEDLNRLNPGFLHNQVSPTTKRRSKKINDCIAMLTGKIQEKLGKPFLECKETQSAKNVNTQSNTEAKLVLPSPEIKETKPTKRKALTRKIVKCDQSSEPKVEVMPPMVEQVSLKEPEFSLTVERLVEQTTTSSKRSSTKQLQLQMEQIKESLGKEPPLSGTSSDTISTKETPSKMPKLLPEKSVVLKESSSRIPKLLSQKPDKTTILVVDEKSKPVLKETSSKVSKLLSEKPVVLKETPPSKVSKILSEKPVVPKETLSKVSKLLPEQPDKTIVLVADEKFKPLLKETPSKVSKLLSEKTVALKETPTKVSKVLSEKTVLRETPSDVSSLIDPKLKEVLLMKPPAKNPPYKEPKLKESFSMESLLQETPVKNLPKELQLRNLLKDPPLKDSLLKDSALHPFKPPFEDFSTNSQHSLREPPTKKELAVNRRTSMAGHPSTGTLFTNNQQFLTNFNPDLRQQDLPLPYTTNFNPVSSGSRAPPPPVTIEIVTPAPVLLNDIVPKNISNQLPILQGIINAADTIRVPCVKPPPQQLSIPQFMPVQQQLPAPRGMISKRRQTIAGAPNDFLFEMNSLRCANVYNNLPFELEVPLDLSKKPKRGSPKSKQSDPKVQPPVHFPQISVKSNAVLMPPVPYQLPILPQTQIIPILSDSLLPNVPQMPLQAPPLVFPKEITPKPTTPSTPRKRTTNSKKQDPVIININPPPLVNMSVDTPPPKKVSRKTTMPMADDKLKPDFNQFPTENTKLIKDSILSMPVEMNIKTTCKEKTKATESTKSISVEAIPNSPTQQTITTLEGPTNTPPSKTILSSDKVAPDQTTPVATTTLLSEVRKPEVEQKMAKVDLKETKKLAKGNKKPLQITTTPKKDSPSLSSKQPTSSNQATTTVDFLGKTESKNESSPESQKSLPTRRSRRNKASEQQIELKNSALPINTGPPPSALKEVEEIAASFVSDDEPEIENTDLPLNKQQRNEESTVTEKPPEPIIESVEQEKTKNVTNVTRKSELIPQNQSSQMEGKSKKPEPTSPNQSSQMEGKTKESEPTPPIQSSEIEGKAKKSEPTPPNQSSQRERKSKKSEPTAPNQSSEVEGKTKESEPTPPIESSEIEGKAKKCDSTPPNQSSLRERKSKKSEPTPPNQSSQMDGKTKKTEPTPPNQSPQMERKPLVTEPNELVTKKTEIEPTTTKQESSKKPRRRRKNELASIVADQLMESFKETDKSRIDDLKRLEELAYEKSEDLLLTGMRLMPTTKRKNVLDNKKDFTASELDPKMGNSVKESKKQKAESTREKPSTVVQKADEIDSKTKTELAKENKKEKALSVQKDVAELFKDPKDVQKIEMKSKNQIGEPPTTTNQPKLTGKDDLKTRPPPIDFGSYRSNSLDSWSNRGSKLQSMEQVSPTNDKSPTSETMPLTAQKDKKNKKKQMKKRDKKIETENINQLRTGLESFTLSKDVVDNGNDTVTTIAVTREPELSHSVVDLFSPIQANLTGNAVAGKEASPFGNFGNVKTSSSILRPSILAASLDIVATNKENPQPSGADRKSNISSRDPRLNKNIHTEEGDQVSVPPETTSRLATLRTRRKSFADATPPTYSSRANTRSTPSKRATSGSRRNSLAFDDDEDDNYLTAIAKRVNDNIMSAEDKDFNLANDGFELANSFIDQDDPFGRPSTSMSVRSAPNFNEDRSNMDTMDATNTDLIDMDVDDDMSVYTTFSQDTTRSKGGRRRRRRRSVLLTRKPKKTNVNMLDSMETFDCLLCNKKFAKAVALNKHQLTIAHVSKISEQEYLNATRKQEEEKANAEQQSQHKDVAPAAKSNTTPPSATARVAESPKQYFNAIQSIRLEGNTILPSKVTETLEKTLVEKVQKPHQPKVPFIPPNSILNQSGIEPISSPEQNYERYSTKTSSRLTLNPDERLFYECCNILKGSETPLVERNYPIVPPTTYAYDLQVKPVTPKSPNERFSYIKQTNVDINGKRDSGSYPRLDVNQFSDISSDSNPACAQAPPVLPVNYAQMHVLSGAKNQSFLANDGVVSGVQRSNLPRESSILQMASIASPSLITPAPLTARTFVNQPSQIGTHLHGMDISAAVGQKQNFISPLHSASSQSSTITTTTSRLKTKAAMKGYDNLKVSIPTIGLDMEHALERSPRPGCKLTTLADIALGHETPHTTFTPSLQMHNEQKSKCKQKPTNNENISAHFPTILQSQPKENQVSQSKKRDNSPIKESSLVISVHDTESCMPIVLSSPKKPESIIPKDIYEFDDSENTPISKAIQSPFKIADDNEAGPKKAIIIPDRPFKNIGMEEKEAIKFQKPETPAINDENTTSTVTYSDRDDFVYGSMSGGDDDNDNDNDNEDNKETHLESDESSNSSAFTAKTFENKSLIMGRIFKNAKTKPKISIEKPVLPAPEPPKQIPKQELDRLFDTLRGVNENRQAAKEDRHENVTNSSRKRQNQSTKKKPTVTAPKPPKSKTTPDKPNKRVTKQKEQQPTSKEMSQLHAELGMSPAEIAELIGEGQRKSQRRCAVNRPKKLVEIWSSDEFEEFLSTKDIIALIEEKEQKTKKKRKTASTPAAKKPISTTASSKNNNNKKDVEEQSVTQSEDEKSESAPASPQKRLKGNTLDASKAAKVATATKNSKTSKTKKKTPTAPTTTAAPAPKVTARAQKDTKPTSTSGKSSVEATKTNSSPFKKPTQKNIISKIAADDSESDFEAELNRKTKTAGPIRNRRKTISGKLENDAGSSSSSCAKKVSGKSKTDKSDSRNSSKTKTSSQPSSQADSSQSSSRPQARRKRIASEMLYYWSSSSDEEFGRIESPHDDEHHIEENENYQQHGWIVGDSHKKLVTLLAIAKGNKKVDDCGVKETSSKKKS